MRVIRPSDLRASSTRKPTTIPHSARPVRSPFFPARGALAGAACLLLSVTLAAPPAQAQTDVGKLTLSLGTGLHKVGDEVFMTEGVWGHFTVTASPTPTSNVEMTYSITRGTAEASDLSPPGGKWEDKFTASPTSPSPQFSVITRNDTDTDDETYTLTLTIDTAGWTWDGPNSVEVTIVDDDRPKPTVTVAVSPTVMREGQTGTLTVALSDRSLANTFLLLSDPDRTEPDSVFPYEVPNTAPPTGFDAANSLYVRIPRYATEFQTTFTARQDDDLDDETVVLNVHTIPAGWTKGSPDSATVTIVDDDRPTPKVTLTAAPHPVTEGNDVTLTATLSSALAASVTLDLELAAGTAEAGDYGSADSITIAAGATTGTATISTAQDTDKDDETFTVKLVDLPDSVAAGNPTSLTVTIADDDKPPPPVSLAATPTVVREGSSITVTVAVPVALPSDVKVPLSYADGSGTSAPADYSAPPSVTIAAGKTSATGTITTMTNSDTASDEFTVSLDASHADWPDTVSAGSPSSVKLSIVDSSVSKPEVGVYARGKTSIDEGETAELVVRANAAPDFDMPVLVRISAPGDFVPPAHVGDRLVTLRKGDPDLNLDIPTIDDDDNAPLGAIVARIARSPGGWYLIAGSRGMDIEQSTESLLIAVNDNDSADVRLSVSPNPVAEGAEVTVTATLAEDLDSDLTVPLELADGTAESSDHGALASSVTITAGDTSASTKLTTAQDADEDDETFTVSIGASLSGVRAGNPSSVTVAIVDDDKPTPTVSLSAPLTVVAGSGAEVTVTLSSLVGTDVTVPLAIAPAGAEPAEIWDYGAPASVTVPAGMTSATGTIATVQDRDGDNETFTVSLGTLPAGVVAGSPTSATVTIIDHTKGTVRVTVTKTTGSTVREGEAIRANVRADPAPSFDLPVNVDIGNASGTYVVPRQEVFIIPKGVGHAVHLIPTIDDGIDGVDGRVGVKLEPGAGYTRAGFGFTIAVLDNNIVRPRDLPAVSLSAAPNPVDEGSEVTVTATLSEALADSVTIPLALGGGAADTAAAEDYGSADDITIAAGSLTGTTTITTTDDADAAHEIFTVALGALPSGVAAGTHAAMPVVIKDGDTATPPPVLVRLAVSPIQVAEGSPVTVTATLSGALADNVTIPLTLGGGAADTAEPGDYGALPSITIAGGSTAGADAIRTTDDADTEHETFTVALGAPLPSGVVAGTPNAATVVINDGDTPAAPPPPPRSSPPPQVQPEARTPPGVTFSASSVTVSEAGGQARYTVVLDARPTGAVTVTSVSQGAATVSPPRLTFTASTWDVPQVVTVTGMDDAVDNPGDERLAAVLHSISGGGYDEVPAAVLVTVLDDDDRVGMTLSPSSVTVSEAGGEAGYTAVLNEQPTGTVTVTVAGDAPAAAEVRPAVLTFTRVNWNRPRRVTVRGVNDDVDNPGDARRATITHAGVGGGYRGVSLPSVTVTVTDDDTAGVTLSTSALPVAHGDEATYTVVLDTEPLGAVRVTPRSSAAETATVSGPLTFTPGNWNEPQPVTVRVAQGAQVGRRVTLTHGVAGYGGVTTAASVTVTVSALPASLPRAWLSRFGRTIGTHMTDAVGARLRAPAGLDSHVTVGGYRLSLKPGESLRGAALLEGLAGFLGLGPGGSGRPEEAFGGWETDPRRDPSRPVHLDLRRVLLGSSFRLHLGAAGATSPRLTAWGRVAGTRFDGRDGALTLDGDVLTGTVGVDRAWGRWLAGLAVSHSRGDGGYTRPLAAAAGQRGDLDAALTSLHPYLRYRMTDRLDVWGLLGYGWGSMTLAPATGPAVETDTTLLMGAVGGRGILLPAAEHDGFELATRTDLMLTRMTSGAAAGLAGADGDAHRLRLILEGSRGVTWEEGRRLTPTVELGLRHDWGDAETGFGLELGGRVQYVAPAQGLSVEVAVRGLLAHEARAYKEWGAQGTLRLDPGVLQPGLALTVAPGWGAAASGVEDLWARQTTAGLAPRGPRAAPGGRLNAEVGYGLAAPFGAGLVTPYAGTVLTAGADRTYRVGTRVQVRGPAAGGLTLRLEGMRREAGGRQPVNQGLRLQADWQF